MVEYKKQEITMKVVSYNEMIDQPDGTICAQYCDGKIGDIFMICESVGHGFTYVKFFKYVVYAKDAVHMTWEHAAVNNHYIGKKYGFGTYIILDINDIINGLIW